jgi:hypothetical protein
MIQLVCRFTGVSDDFLERARPALELLRDPGRGPVRLARSTEVGDTWVLTAQFESVPAYRRTLSSFAAKTVLVPFLSTADIDTSGVFEVRYGADGDTVVEYPGIVDH